MYGPSIMDRPTAAGGGQAEAVLEELARAGAGGAGPWRQFRPPRLAGRSSVFFVETVSPVGGGSRLVVKRARPDWSQDDLASPVMAGQEFQALARLHAHFVELGGRGRVPRPVAMLDELEAFAMEYVPGRSLRDLLGYRSLLRPGRLLDGLAAAAEFLRQVHDLETLPTVPVDLRAEADAVLSLAEQKLSPEGLALPRSVTRVLGQVPSVMAEARQVWLHGDFGPTNIILAEDGSTVGIDPALNTLGPPEEDLARFVALMSGAICFAPEIVAPPVRRVRRRLEKQLLRSYYATTSFPPLFDLKLLHQLVGRWLRLRELAQQFEKRSRLPLRLRVVGAQMHLLMRDSSRRLVQSMADETSMVTGSPQRPYAVTRVSDHATESGEPGSVDRGGDRGSDRFSRERTSPRAGQPPADRA